jgi:hypothetical protein
MAAPTLVLRDIHQPPAPPWWPPAPGWWLLGAVLLLAVGAAIWGRARQRRRRRQVAALFDDAVAGANSPSGEVAAISELLRRAARRHDPAADRLQGEAWLEFLERGARRARGKQALPAFAGEPGRLLLEGGYRPDVTADEVAALRPQARALFLHWMSRR